MHGNLTCQLSSTSPSLSLFDQNLIFSLFSQELLKAEQWAKDHGHPFPQIKGNPITEDPNIRECYVFENEDDAACPMILHFPIVNKTFREFVKPG